MDFIKIKEIYNFLGILLKLARIDSCALTFLIVFIPVIYRTGLFLYSFILAIPIFLIAMCGFIINDINDIERDNINHPDRPLPKKAIRITTAVIAYFFLLAATLISIKLNEEKGATFYYILFLIGFINYSYIVNHFAWLKNFYVAVVGGLPLLLAISFTNLSSVYLFAVASFMFFMLGREILMDTLDVAGDNNTLPLKIGSERAIILGFGAQYLGGLSLVPLCNTSLKFLLLISVNLITFLFSILWKNKNKKWLIIKLMRLQWLPCLLLLA